MNSEWKPPPREAIAIVGMACLLPKASSLTSYWDNILATRDCTTFVPDDHSWGIDEHYDADPAAPDKTYCRRGGFLDKTPFDPIEFGLPPNVLDATDTSQLLGLIVAREALKDAGIDPDSDRWPRERTACILGVTGTQELAIALGSRLHGPKWRKAMQASGIDDATADRVVADIGQQFPEWQEQSFPGLLGNVVAGRIANRLDLGGTNCVVDAACASSLAAIQLALADLQMGKADLAISGGVDTLNDIFMYMCFSKTPALSKSEEARPFDETGDGILISEGLAMCVLKRLSDAERDGDRIYAVIRGIGSSSDGRAKSIYAPNSIGQTLAIQRAYEDAGFPLESVELIEAHGTGTKAGDAAEAEGLRATFSASQRAGRHVAVGTVKSQIGHTKATAGAAGLVKAALALYQRVLPPTAKVDVPNPKMGFDSGKLYLNTIARPWVRAKDHPRRAGVSAFGFGGSNFHLALEEHGDPDSAPPIGEAAEQLFLFAGPTPESLLAKLEATRQATAPTVAHAAREVLTAWASGPYVVAFTASSLDERNTRLDSARALVETGAPGTADGVHFARPTPADARLAFLFPGQGSQYVDMGRTLMLRHPIVRAALDRAEDGCVRAGTPGLGERIFPPPAFDDAARDVQARALTATEWAQPALGAVSKGMYDLLMSFGVQPEAVAGHSYGELVALHAAGVLDESALWTASRVRGAAMADRGADRGTMAAVSAGLNDIQSALDEFNASSGYPTVMLANRNHPKQGVISGSKAAIRAALDALGARGLAAKEIQVSAAFHSPLVADAATPLAEALKTLAFLPPRIPVYSDATAHPYPADPDAARELLVRQITSPVDFVGIVDNLYASGVRTFVECGPKGVLAGLLRHILKGRLDSVFISLDRDEGRVDGDAQFKRALAVLAARGVPVDVEPLLREPLPTLPKKTGSKATVWLSGANYVKPETRNPPPPAPRPTIPPVIPHTPSVLSSPSQETPMRHPSDPRPPTPVDANALSALLDSTRQSLVAFQQAQERTAAVHAEFLRAHTKANESFQGLFASHTRLVEIALSGGLSVQNLPMAQPFESAGLSPSPTAVVAVERSFLACELESTKVPLTAYTSPEIAEAFGRVTAAPPARPRVAATDDMPALLWASAAGELRPFASTTEAPTRRSVTAPADRPIAATSTLSKKASAGTSREQVVAAVLATVADKTGYPIEMLELGMDLESDLGIDSIKRVEILSAVQERVAGLPEIDNERLSMLRTLGDIATHLSDLLGPVEEASAGYPAAKTVDAQPASTAVDHAAIVQAMLATVADKTGYPAEMLELGMDMESDLGIDSIKRVEILSAVQERVPGLPEMDNDAMSRLRTLGDVVNHLAVSVGCAPTAISAVKPAPSVGTSQETSPALRRREVELASAPAGQRRLLRGHFLITADLQQKAAELASALARLGMESTVIDPDWTAADPFAPFDVRRPRYDGVVHLAAFGATGHDLELRLRGAFLLARATGPSLRFATVSGLGGRFGETESTHDPREGALGGLVKTAAQEWEGVTAVAIDVDPRRFSADAIATELVHDRGVHEVGLTDTGVLSPLTVDRALGQFHSAPIRPGDLVVVSGGARGVTAAVALEMARRWAPTLLLLGRSAAPAEEPAWALGIPDTGLKPTRLATQKGEPKLSPRELEREVNAVLAAREVRQTLDALRETGVTARYAMVNVRDVAAVNATLAEASATHGPVRGLVHGAGVLADKRIIEKTPEQFDAVYGTKVGGLDALLEAIPLQDLAFVALFGSVAGRFGNRGQCDYAMANEALAKIGHDLARRGIPRVKCFAWGPWEAGMVTPPLKKQLEARGMAMIPVEGGARLFADELERSGGSVEVVVGGPEGGALLPSSPLTDRTTYAPNKGYRKIRVSVNDRAFLRDHQIRGKAVLPVVMVLEWMVRAAAEAHPQLAVTVVRDFAVMKGIIVDTETELTLNWERVAVGAQTLLECTLTRPREDGSPLLHYRATIELASTTAVPAPFQGSNGLARDTYPYAVADAYRRFLFHGPALRGIEQIHGFSDHGIVVRLRTSTPAALSDEGLAWATDPLILDSALQAMVLWVREKLGSAALPSRLGEYRQHAPFRGSVTCHLDMRPGDGATGVFDAHFVDDAGQIVAELRDGEYTKNPAMNDAFQSAA